MLKKPKAKLKSEVYQEKKKELAEDLDYLRQVELPEIEGGGSKFVHDERIEGEKKEKEVADQIKNYLESRKSQQFGYRDRLANYAFTEITKQLFPADWEYYCIPTDGRDITVFGKKFKTQEGIVYVIKSPKGEVYIRAVGVTYSPDIDFHNVGMMVTQIENTIDSWKGLLLSDNKDTTSTFTRTPSGIILPN